MRMFQADLCRLARAGCLLTGLVLWASSAQAQAPAQPSAEGANAARAEQGSDQQSQLLADARRLREMAQELKESVDKSTKDTLSVEVIRHAEQIEKLARQTRERLHP